MALEKSCSYASGVFEKGNFLFDDFIFRNLVRKVCKMICLIYFERN